MAELPETRISLLCRFSQNPNDSQSWSELVALYQLPIYRTLRGRRLQHADAMEVTQQVLVTLVRYLPQFESDGNPASFRRWLNRIISNLCWKAWISRQKTFADAFQSHANDGPGYEDVADQQQQQELRRDLEIQHYRHRLRLAATLRAESMREKGSENRSTLVGKNHLMYTPDDSKILFGLLLKATWINRMYWLIVDPLAT